MNDAKETRQKFTAVQNLPKRVDTKVTNELLLFKGNPEHLTITSFSKH
jgi:hypothetical protein